MTRAVRQGTRTYNLLGLVLAVRLPAKGREKQERGGHKSLRTLRRPSRQQKCCFLRQQQQGGISAWTKAPWWKLSMPNFAAAETNGLSLLRLTSIILPFCRGRNPPDKNRLGKMETLHLSPGNYQRQSGSKVVILSREKTNHFES